MVIDRERSLNFNLPNVTRIEGTHTVKTVWAGNKGLWEASKQLAGHLRNAVIGAFEGGGAANVDPWAEAIGVGAALVAGVAGATTAFSLAMVETEIPQVVHLVNIRLYGNRNSTRASLTAAAFSMLASRLTNLTGAGIVANNVLSGINEVIADVNKAIGNVPGQGFVFPWGITTPEVAKVKGVSETDLKAPQGLPIPASVLACAMAGFECEITHDIAGKMVDLKFATLGSPFSLFFSGAAAFNLFLGNDDTLLLGDTTGLGISSEAWDALQGNPGTSQGRGTYLKQLVSQILLQPCQTPPKQRVRGCPVALPKPAPPLAVLEIEAPAMANLVQLQDLPMPTNEDTYVAPCTGPGGFNQAGQFYPVNQVV